MVGRAVRPQIRPTERASRSASATINRLAAQGFGRVSAPACREGSVAARPRGVATTGGRQRKNTANSPGCETKARDHRRYNGRKNPLAAGKCREKRGFGGIRGQNRAKISRSGGKRSRSGVIPGPFRNGSGAFGSGFAARITAYGKDHCRRPIRKGLRRPTKQPPGAVNWRCRMPRPG